MIKATAVFLVVLFLSGIIASDPVLSDDAPFNTASHKDSPFYLETWFYHFYDPVIDVAGEFVFGITVNNTFMMDIIAVSSRTVTRNTPSFSPSEVFMSQQNASMVMGSNLVEVLDFDNYHIKCNSEAIQADLTFTRSPGFEPVFGYQNVLILGQPFNWISFIPTAHVEGHISINGTTYEIEATGYHDHWAEFTPYDWRWASVSSSRLSIIVYDFPGTPFGNMWITSNDEGQFYSDVFEKDQIDLQLYYDENGNPNGANLHVDTGKNSTLNYTLLARHTIPIQEGVFYEQIVEWSGSSRGYGLLDFVKTTENLKRF